ncbi:MULTISPECIES: MGMT family protein [Nocardiopsis]|uniref:MGMT family protein n=1 Tax=Nocardiopsis TaxID=2013 RepID=UPI0003450F5D|nr:MULTISPECIES: MGMT family protein [Nocardiopsis]PWV44890.1 alkylated DNA nucleotide flippase Atl1 [Nocardiopsis sp. L17-MgMaSL7]
MVEPHPREPAEDEESEPVDEYTEEVLSVVERIPSGRVMSYGDIAEYVGRGGPRQVGSVMSRWGGGVPWWRVVRSDGRPAEGHLVRARSHYAAEATPMRPSGDRVDMREARWDGGSGA